MLRAFGLLSLVTFAACVATSHAAAPPPQRAGAWGPAPQDPYAGDGEATAFNGQTCGQGATCSFECAAGGCAYYCAEGSTCNVECDGGNCELSCAPGATCNFECDGGRCGAGCGATATCNLECDGGSCAQACAPEATCNLECDGGNCRG